MIRKTCPCPACDQLIQLVCVEEDDVGKAIFLRRKITVLHDDDIGWQDARCESCNFSMSSDLVEAR